MAHTAAAIAEFQQELAAGAIAAQHPELAAALAAQLEQLSLDLEHPMKRSRFDSSSVCQQDEHSSATSSMPPAVELLRLEIGNKLVSLPMSLFAGAHARPEVRESFFGLLASGRMPSERNEATGAFIIHRDPRHFAAVAQYLSSGTVPARYRFKTRHHARAVAFQTTPTVTDKSGNVDADSASIGRGPVHAAVGLDEDLPGATAAEVEELASDADYYLLPGLVAQVRGAESMRMAQLGPANWQMRIDENAARAVLTTAGQVTDPFLHLIDIYADAETTASFTFASDVLRPCEASVPPSSKYSDYFWGDVPTIMATKRHIPPADGRGLHPSAITPTAALFRKKFFGEISPALAPDSNEASLSQLDWTGDKDGTGISLFVAGGSVLSALLSKPADDRTADAFAGSDIDLFMVDKLGRSPEEVHQSALTKMQLIEDSILRFVASRGKPQPASRYRRSGSSFVVMRTSRTITFVAGSPQRHIQVILRIYQSPAEVLLGFDLDCVACGFDGHAVYCLPRARRAIIHRVNVADPTRQTFRTNSYEYRLWKYSKRGFAVAIPGFDRDLVHSEVYLKKFGELTGLGRLLFFEERDYYKQFVIHNYPTWDEEREDMQKRIPYDSARRVSALDSLNGMNMRVNDYNRESVLPYAENTSAESLSLRLQSRLERILNGYVPDAVPAVAAEKNGGSAQLPHLFFVFSDNLKGVLHRDSCGRKMLKDSYLDNRELQRSSKAKAKVDDADAEVSTVADDNSRPLDVDAAELASAFGDAFFWHLPQSVHFIGSVAEYAASLPVVEDDWFADAYGTMLAE